MIKTTPLGTVPEGPTTRMTGAYVQGNTYFGGSAMVGPGPINLTFPANVTAGDLIIGCATSSVFGGEGLFFTDSQGNTYTEGNWQQAAGLAMSYSYAIAKTTGPCTVTMTLGSAEQYVRMLIHEYTGYGAYDTGAYSAGTWGAGGTIAQTQTITTTVANDLIFAWAIDNGGISSYSSPMAARLTAGTESSGDNAGATNNPGTQTITVNTGQGGGGMLTSAFKPAGMNPIIIQVTAYNPTVTAETDAHVAAPRNDVAVSAYNATVNITGPRVVTPVRADVSVAALQPANYLPSNAYIQGTTYVNTTTSITSFTLTLPQVVTVGDLLIVAGAWQSSGWPTLTDNQGNTWNATDTHSPPQSPGFQSTVYWTWATATGPYTVTATFNATALPVYFSLQEYTYGSLDVWTWGQYLGATATLPITTTVNNDLLFAWCFDGTGINSYSPPLSVRQTVAPEATGDNAGATNYAGSQTVTANTGGGGGLMYVTAFKPLILPPVVPRPANVNVLGNFTSTNPAQGHPIIAAVAAAAPTLATIPFNPPNPGSYVQGSTYASGTTPKTTFTISLPFVTVGDLIILAAGYATTGYPTIHDNMGTSGAGWNDAGYLGSPGSGYQIDVYSTTAKASGPYTVTVTMSAPTAYLRFALQEYTGYGPLDGAAVDVQYSGGTATGTITTTQANDLIFAWTADNTGTVNSFTAPMAVRQFVGGEATGDNAGLTNQLGPQTVTAATGGGGGAMIIQAFKATGVASNAAQAGVAAVAVTPQKVSTKPLTVYPDVAQTSVAVIPPASPLPLFGAYVQGKTFTTLPGPATVTSFSLTLNQPVSAGDLIVVAGAWPSQAIPTLSDNQGNGGAAWSDYGVAGLSGYNQDIWWLLLKQTANPYTLNVTFTQSVGFIRFTLQHYTGYSAAIDGANSGSFGTTTGTFKVNTTVNNDLLFAWTVSNAGQVNGYIPPLATRQVAGGDASGDSLAINTAGQQTFSVSSQQGGFMQALALKPSLVRTTNAVVSVPPVSVFAQQNPHVTPGVAAVTVTGLGTKSAGLTMPLASVSVSVYVPWTVEFYPVIPPQGVVTATAYPPDGFHISPNVTTQVPNVALYTPPPGIGLMWLDVFPQDANVAVDSPRCYAGQAYEYSEVTTELTVEPALYSVP